jgi:hypothetical protein
MDADLSVKNVCGQDVEHVRRPGAHNLNKRRDAVPISSPFTLFFRFSQRRIAGDIRRFRLVS